MNRKPKCSICNRYFPDVWQFYDHHLEKHPKSPVSFQITSFPATQVFIDTEDRDISQKRLVDIPMLFGDGETKSVPGGILYHEMYYSGLALYKMCRLLDTDPNLLPIFKVSFLHEQAKRVEIKGNKIHYS